jgi:hypothetical protein
VSLALDARAAGEVARVASWATPDCSRADERLAQCRLVRDVFGNPFRLAALDPAWLAWEGGTVVKLAQAVYDDRAFDCLPVLADALEDAGCEQADVLDHLRGHGAHVRGCWAVDLLLGKE